MSGKKEEAKERAENSEGSYEIDEDVSDEEIEDDGQVSSEHSSINLEEYLRHRDAIPDDPSDEEEEEEFVDSDEEEEDEEESSEEKPKASKRAALAAKKKEKEASEKKES